MNSTQERPAFSPLFSLAAPLYFLSLCGCGAAPMPPAEKDLFTVSQDDKQNEASPPADEEPPKGAPPSLSSDCRNAAEIESDGDLARFFMIRGELSVVRVGPDDRLMLRARPDHKSAALYKLKHNEGGLRPSGRVCPVDGKDWYELRYRGQLAWASGKFLSPTTIERDVTNETLILLKDFQPSSPSALVGKIKEAKELSGAGQVEPRWSSRVLGLKMIEDQAEAELLNCCQADDSIEGEQMGLHMRKQGGVWTLVSAQSRALCYRGSSADRKLCL